MGNRVVLFGPGGLVLPNFVVVVVRPRFPLRLRVPPDIQQDPIVQHVPRETNHTQREAGPERGTRERVGQERIPTGGGQVLRCPSSQSRKRL